jgi:hypothetical protein
MLAAFLPTSIRREILQQNLMGSQSRPFARREHLAAARKKPIRVIEKRRGLAPAELVEAAVEETLSYYAFPGGTLVADSHQG